ncbi:hypothetical protein [Caldimonas sp. KR1-144]|uniref:hypothetical protein n=1 Tax=Caldimonas sp. KR1-144 TaxID=3400911 RepID=UPI003C030F44
MTCQDCADARRQGCCHCVYTLTCEGCKARMLAKSLAAYKAIEKGEPDDLRDALQRIFPKLPVKQSKLLVWEWWDLLHPKETTP